MSKNEHQPLSELSEILFREESLDLENRRLLEGIINSSQEAKEAFLIQCELEAALHDTAGLALVEKPVRLPKPHPGRTHLRSAIISLSVAACLVIGLVVWFHPGDCPDGTESARFNEVPTSEQANPDRLGQMRSKTSSPPDHRRHQIEPELALAEMESLERELLPKVDLGIVNSPDLNSKSPGSASNDLTGTATTTLGMVRSVFDGTGPWEPGNRLTVGNHVVNDGTVLFDLDSGVRLKVVGPSRFSIQSGKVMSLETGRISAEVFPSAKGFEVGTKGVTVVDYGTRFAVTANQKGDAAVHVYDGLVTARTKTDEGIENFDASVLGTGDTVRHDPATGTLESIRFDESLFAPQPKWSGKLEWHSPEILVLDEPPRRATEAALPENRPVIFQERSGVVLRRDLDVNLLTGIAPLSGSNELRWNLPRGTMLSSYLLHARTPLSNSGIARVSGEIRFDSPILGIIYDSDLLDETDSTTGARRTQYPEETGHRGAEVLEVDRHLVLGENYRSLRFSFSAPHMDQLRILVAED